MGVRGTYRARVERKASLSSLLVFISYNLKIKKRDLQYRSCAIQELEVVLRRFGGIIVDFIAVIRSRISVNSAQRHEESVILVQLRRTSALEMRCIWVGTRWYGEDERRKI